MSDVTKLLQAFQEEGVPSDELINSIYGELRRIASRQLKCEKSSLTLQSTALVHEAYQQLFKSNERHFGNRKQFFAAAAETMRRVLVDRARRRLAKKRGGDLVKHNLADVDIAAPGPPREIIDLNDALGKLSELDGDAAELVKLRYFVGLTIQETAETLGISVRSANRVWKYARTWLHREIRDSESTNTGSPES
jgi:RNA polymerase sigma factor (TIGR02999 family)